MENVLPPTKKLKTTDGQGAPTSYGYDIEPTLKRKNQSKRKKKKRNKKKKGLIPMADTLEFLKGDYPRAMHEYFQKRGVDLKLTYDTEEHKSNTPNSKKVFVCTCKAVISAFGQAKSKKEAARNAALAVMKRMELIPKGADDPDYEGVWQLRALSGSTGVVVVKKKKEELLAEREIDEEEKTYTGIVKFYRERQKWGFISVDEDINFKGATTQRNIYAAKDDIVCYSDTVGMHEKTKVVFKIYKDSLGLGAYEVMNEDGSPIIYDPNPQQRKRAKLKAKKYAKSKTDAKPKKTEEEEIKPIIEHKQYLLGNFRGALMEFLHKKHPELTVEYEIKTHAAQGKLFYIAKCKAVGGETEEFKELEGVGQASKERPAGKLAALDYMFKLKLLTPNQHFQIHPQKKDDSADAGTQSGSRNKDLQKEK